MDDDLFIKREDGKLVDRMHETYNTLDPNGNLISGKSIKLANDGLLGLNDMDARSVGDDINFDQYS